MQTGEVHKVHIVGIGDDGLTSLTEIARRHIDEADLLLGSGRALEMVPPGPAERVSIGTDLDGLVHTIEAGRADKKIVVLASGDPLFYGVARLLCDRLGKETFEVLPHVSSMQLAFARVKESWEEAYLGNVAHTPMETVIERIRVAEKVGLFTDDEHTPAAVAAALLAEGIDYFLVYVCENLGCRNEIVTQATLAEVSRMEFGRLNVMILVRRPDVPDQPRATTEAQHFGNPDEVFRQSRPKRGLLTPAEVRTLALGQLDVRRASIVWDVGAGSGAVSIEAAQLAPEGAVYAIEPDIEDGELIRDNCRLFKVTNVHVVAGRAPESFASLPAPDCVFIGGTGRETVGILSEAFARLKPGGHLVANVASLENVSSATATFKRLVDHVGLLMVNLARGTHQLDSVRFEAMNPSFLVYVQKPRH